MAGESFLNFGTGLCEKDNFGLRIKIWGQNGQPKANQQKFVALQNVGLDGIRIVQGYKTVGRI